MKAVEQSLAVALESKQLAHCETFAHPVLDVGSRSDNADVHWSLSFGKCTGVTTRVSCRLSLMSKTPMSTDATTSMPRKIARLRSARKDQP